MRAAGVVVGGHPGVEGGLYVLERGEGLVVSEQVPAQGLVETLDLACRGR